MTLIELIGTFAAATLVGGMVFFPSVVAPTVFQRLDAKSAGDFLRALFPRYYLFIIISATISALMLYAQPLIALIFGMIALSTLAIRQFLVPMINAWRDAELAGDTTAARYFALGHRVSVFVNLAQLVGAIAALWLLIDPLA